MKPSREMDFSEMISHIWRAPRFEPEERIKDTQRRGRGERHLPVRPKHHGHTYPIRGGISLQAVNAKLIWGDGVLLKAILGDRFKS